MRLRRRNILGALRASEEIYFEEGEGALVTPNVNRREGAATIGHCAF